MKTHRSEFLRVLKEEFPELSRSLNAESGLLHFEMDAFRRFVQDAISQQNETVVVRAFELAEKAFVDGNTKLQNGIDVSFVEPMTFNLWAWERLPEKLKGLYVRFHGRSGA